MIIGDPKVPKVRYMKYKRTREGATPIFSAMGLNTPNADRSNKSFMFFITANI